MKAVAHFLKKHLALFLAGVAVLLDSVFTIEPQHPWYVTGAAVYSATQLFIFAKALAEGVRAVAGDLEWLHRRVHRLERAMCVLQKRTYHPEDCSREAIAENGGILSMTIYQMFSREGEQRSVTFGELPPFLIRPHHDGRYSLLTDLGDEEYRLASGPGKEFHYRTRVLDGVTREQVLKYVDREVESWSDSNAVSRDRRRNAVLFEGE